MTGDHNLRISLNAGTTTVIKITSTGKIKYRGSAGHIYHVLGGITRRSERTN